MQSQLAVERGRVAAGKIRVLYLIDQLCEMGGAERVLINMVRLLPRDRFCCSVATFKIDPSIPLLKDFPCPLHVLPLSRTYDWNALKVAARLRQLIRREGIGIVHTFFETSDLWGGLVARLSGCRVLVSSRRDMGILRSRKHRLLYRLANRLVDQVQTVSEQVRRYCVEEDRLDPGKVVTLYNGVAERDPAATNQRTRAGWPDLALATHVIGTVAHIRRIKGIDVLLRAAELVCKQYPRAVFLVIGEPHEPECFLELLWSAQQAGLAENVRFLRGVEDVFSILRACDVFCLLSRSEGLSNAVLEAMACGLPCVVTDVGGNGELIQDGRNGYLVRNEDAAAAAERILWLLGAPERARAMGCESEAIVRERFTLPAMIGRLASLYERLWDEPGGRDPDSEEK